MDLWKAVDNYGLATVLVIVGVFGAWRILRWLGRLLETSATRIVNEHVGLIEDVRTCVKQDTRNLAAVAQAQKKIVDRLDSVCTYRNSEHP
jgi:hypothetical protein